MEPLIVEAIESLISERLLAFKSKNAKRAHEIKDSLALFGVELSDNLHGTVWRLTS